MRRNTKRRNQMRKKAATRRYRKQLGGGDREDYEIIRAVYNEDMGALIAGIYTNKALYNSCSEHQPSSLLGGPRARDTSIPERYNRPHHMKPLNSVLRCAYNFFQKHANRVRGADTEPHEWGMAEAINKKLTEAFWIFVAADPELNPSRGKREKAEKLFRRIESLIAEQRAAPIKMNAAYAAPVAPTANYSEPTATAEEIEAREKNNFLRALRERANTYLREKHAAAEAAEKAKANKAGYWNNIRVAERNIMNRMRRAGIEEEKPACGGAGCAAAPAANIPYNNVNNIWRYP